MANLVDSKVNGDLRVTGTVFGTQAGNYGVCSTDGATAAKSVSINGFTLTNGIHVFVKFTNGNTAATADLTLNVSGTGAKGIRSKGGANLGTPGSLTAGAIYEFIYDDPYWKWIGSDVTGVKGDSESSYRTGNVNITAANVGAAPISHASTATTYGVGTADNYGHVKLDNSQPLTLDSVSSNGVATGKAHRHNVIESVPRASVTTADLAHVNPGTKAHMILSQTTSQTSSTHKPGDGYMLTFMWDGGGDSGAFDTQLYVPNGNSNLSDYGRLKFRTRGGANTTRSWGDWEYLPAASTGTLLTSSNSLDSIMGGGKGTAVGYRWNSDSVPTGSPWNESYSGWMNVYQTETTGWTMQILYRARYGVYQRLYRTLDGTTAWTPWAKMIVSTDVMTGATSSANGTVGLVPAPTSAQRNNYLKGDGTWATPTDTKVTQTQNYTESTDFPVLFKNTANTTDETSAVKYSPSVKIVPNQGRLIATNVYSPKYSSGYIEGTSGTAGFVNFMDVECTTYMNDPFIVEVLCRGYSAIRLEFEFLSTNSKTPTFAYIQQSSFLPNGSQENMTIGYTYEDSADETPVRTYHFWLQKNEAWGHMTRFIRSGRWDFTQNNLKAVNVHSNTAPEGITYVTKKSVAYLNSSITGNAATATKPSVTLLDGNKDLNDYKGSSQGDVLWYRWVTDAAPANSPGNNTALMCVLRTHSGSYVKQIVYAAGGQVFTRKCFNGTWDAAWSDEGEATPENYTLGRILGTTSSGKYYKLADITGMKNASTSITAVFLVDIMKSKTLLHDMGYLKVRVKCTNESTPTYAFEAEFTRFTNSVPTGTVKVYGNTSTGIASVYAYVSSSTADDYGHIGARCILVTDLYQRRTVGYYVSFSAEATINQNAPSGTEVTVTTKQLLNSGDVTSTYSATGTAPVNGTAVASAISGKENTSNKVSTFQTTPDNTHYPTEKLVYDNLMTLKKIADGRWGRYNESSGDGWFKIAESPVAARQSVNVVMAWDVAYGSDGTVIRTERLLLNVRWAGANAEPSVGTFRRIYRESNLDALKFCVKVFGQASTTTTSGVELWVYLSKAYHSVAISQYAGNGYVFETTKTWKYYFGTGGGNAKPTADSANHIFVVDTTNTQLAVTASPAFSGTPTAPTASSGTNTTQIATTAFVQTALGGKVTTYSLGTTQATENYTMFARMSSTNTQGNGEASFIVSAAGNIGTQGEGVWLVNISNRGSTPYMAVKTLRPVGRGGNDVQFGYYTDTTNGYFYFGMFTPTYRGRCDIIVLTNSGATCQDFGDTTTAPTGWTAIKKVNSYGVNNIGYHRTDSLNPSYGLLADVHAPVSSETSQDVCVQFHFSVTGAASPTYDYGIAYVEIRQNGSGSYGYNVAFIRENVSNADKHTLKFYWDATNHRVKIYGYSTEATYRGISLSIIKCANYSGAPRDPENYVTLFSSVGTTTAPSGYTEITPTTRFIPRTTTNAAVGGAGTPVYVKAGGEIATCTPSSMSVGSATALVKNALPTTSANPWIKIASVTFPSTWNAASCVLDFFSKGYASPSGYSVNLGRLIFRLYRGNDTVSYPTHRTLFWDVPANAGCFKAALVYTGNNDAELWVWCNLNISNSNMWFTQAFNSSVTLSWGSAITEADFQTYIADKTIEYAKPYGVRLTNYSSSTGIGSSTKPVFLNADKELVECSPASMSVGSATTAQTATSAGKLTTARKAYVTLGTASTTTTVDWSADPTTIPVDGTLAVSHGGTGGTTTLTARYNLLNDVTEETNDAGDNSPILYMYATPGTNNGTIYKRKSSYLWNYIKGKLTSVSGVNISGNAATATADANGNTISSTYLKLSGGTMTGKLTAWASKYTDDGTTCAIDMNNSNIIGLNSIYTKDASDGASEGIHFYRDATHYDTLWMAGGHMYFVPNRVLGTNTTTADSRKVAILPASITTNQMVVTDGTDGNVKTVSAADARTLIGAQSALPTSGTPSTTYAINISGNATTATNSTNSAVTADTTHQLYLIGATGSSGQQALKTDTGIFATSTAGQLQATSYKVTANATIQYNSTDAAVEFVFN